MGTPTLKLTHVSVMNDLGTSYSSIDQSEREREREQGEEGGGQEREVGFRLWQWWHVCYVSLH